MVASANERVRKHRESLRAAGLRPVQIWLPDTRQPGFDEECRRQGRLTAEADASDEGLAEFLDAALDDLLRGYDD